MEAASLLNEVMETWTHPSTFIVVKRWCWAVKLVATFSNQRRGIKSTQNFLFTLQISFTFLSKGRKDVFQIFHPLHNELNLSLLICKCTSQLNWKFSTNPFKSESLHFPKIDIDMLRLSTFSGVFHWLTIEKYLMNDLGVSHKSNLAFICHFPCEHQQSWHCLR